MAVVLDVFSRGVVGWSLARSLQTTLPLAALNQAIQDRQPGAGLVHHSDRGSQYANKQYITTGNVIHNDKVTLFLMDYPNRTRLKILGHAQIVDPDQDSALAKGVAVPNYRSKVERLFKIAVLGFDWNCPQHITPRFTQEGLLSELEL